MIAHSMGFSVFPNQILMVFAIPNLDFVNASIRFGPLKVVYLLRT